MTETPSAKADSGQSANRPLIKGGTVNAKIHSVARILLATEGLVGVLVISTMTLILIAQVATRNLLPFSFFWAEEVARLCLIWMTMLGVAYAIGRGIQLTVTAITDYFPVGVRVWCQRTALLLIIVTGVLLCVSSAQLMESIGGVAASSSSIPRSFYFLASVIGYGLAVVHATLVLLIGPIPEALESPLESGETPMNFTSSERDSV